MRTIEKNEQYQFEINKSIFISFAYFVENENMAKGILEDLSKKYSDATHICYAYVLQAPRVEKCSDNGEPSGTAGKPILEVIKKKKLENVLCVVVRYFGGKKLGAGGLVRAYTNSTNGVLDKCEIINKEKMILQKIEVDIKDGDKVKHQILALGGEITAISYGLKVEILFNSKEPIEIFGYDVKEV